MNCVEEEDRRGAEDGTPYKADGSYGVQLNCTEGSNTNELC